ncbi:hypothetical protein JCM3775_002051 [Rhodotorula graminis]
MSIKPSPPPSTRSTHSTTVEPTPTTSSTYNEKAPIVSSTPQAPSHKGDGDRDGSAASKSPKKDGRFWLIFLTLCCCCFLSALDLTAVSTALPTIAADFRSSEATWIGSAYALTSTALIPWTGGLAAIFGRRPVMIGGILLFALGSALTGAAQSMAMAIGGRSVQGIGGGAILTTVEIVVCDLVPLAERGNYFGAIGAVWALASTLGPPIGGALASAGAWRWLFYLNLPLCGIALALTVFFFKIKAPETTTQEKLDQMDYWNVLFVAAATSTILGLTWGGGTHPWSSYQVLVPLIVGIFGMIAFVIIERKYVKHPTVPFDILVHPNALLGYLTTYLHAVVMLAIVYYFPLYFQMRGYSAVQSGVKIFSISWTIAPFAIITGAIVTVTGHYVALNWIGWAFVTIGCGLMSLLKYNSPTSMWGAFPVIVGIGLGLLYTGTMFPVLAPLKPAQQPYAITFYGFVRSFGQVLGITIGSTVFSNQLGSKLPEAFVSQLGGEVSGDAAYALVAQIAQLAEPIRSEVREAYAETLVVLWQILIGLGGLGFCISLGLKNLALTTEVEASWGVQEKKKEAGAPGAEEESVGR